MLAPKTGEPAAAILSAMPGPVEAEVVLPPQAALEGQGVRVESVGQAAAGGLLLAIAVGELLLGFWSVGWHHRAIALAVAGIGVAFLASGLAEIRIAVRRERSAL